MRDGGGAYVAVRVVHKHRVLSGKLSCQAALPDIYSSSSRPNSRGPSPREDAVATGAMTCVVSQCHKLGSCLPLTALASTIATSHAHL